MTALWPRIITAKNGKKDIKSFAIMILWRKFGLEGEAINTIILFFSDKN